VLGFLFVASLISVLVLGQVPTVSAEDTAIVHHDVSFVSQGVTLRGTVYIPSFDQQSQCVDCRWSHQLLVYAFPRL
jgi:hypothetical protein